MKESTLERWMLLPFVVLLSCGIAFYPVAFITYQLQIWDEPVFGFVTAFLFVTVSYLVAPVTKMRTGLVSFVIGSVLAYWLIGESFYPEHHPLAYQHTSIPFLVTLCGGVLGLGVAGWLEMRRRKA